MDYYPIAPSAWETDVPKFFEFECNQLPKLRAAGSNPVFRSKADRMMPNRHHLFLYYDRPLQIYLHKGWRSTKKSCAPAQRSAFRGPRGERNGNAGGQIPPSGRECTACQGEHNPAFRKELPEAKSLKPFLISSCNSLWASPLAVECCSSGLCPRCANIVTLCAETLAARFSGAGCCPR